MKFIALLLLAVPLPAQQTASPFGKPIAKPVRHQATCNAPASAASMPNLPDLVFARGLSDLVCVRHPDGSSEKVLGGFSHTALSADGDKLAYWNAAKHEVHIYAITAKTDTLLDTLPAATLESISWSSQGHTLSYKARGISPAGTRTFDLDSGKRAILAETPNPRLALTPEAAQIAAAVPNSDSAEYSANGHLLGILANNPDAPGNNATDDSPDCTGGAFALHVYSVSSKKVVKIAFPEGFNSVLDYSFAPDDHAVAVTFGAAACDYPGDLARVYLVSLPDLSMKALSPEKRLSVKARWSPDSKYVLYSDYTGSNSPLISVDIATTQRTVLTTPGNDGPDDFLGWHSQ